jgi:signal peptidase I
MQLVVTLLILGALALVVARFVLGRRWLMVVVTGNSMAPTFRDGQRLLVTRRDATRPLEVGDVVVFSTPQPGELALRIKRVAALGGEPVPTWVGGTSSVVPRAHVVVSGDNPVSQDSRQLGFVPEAAVIAVVST